METGTISEYLKFFVALLAIVNPVGVIPIFINLTADKAEGVRNKNGFMVSISMAACQNKPCQANKRRGT